MSSSLTPEQVVELALKEKAELEIRVKCVQSQLGQLIQERRRNLRSSRSSSKQEDSDEFEGEESNLVGDSGGDEYKGGQGDTIGLRREVTMNLRSTFLNLKAN